MIDYDLIISEIAQTISVPSSSLSYFSVHVYQHNLPLMSNFLTDKHSQHFARALSRIPHDMTRSDEVDFSNEMKTDPNESISILPLFSHCLAHRSA
jgi:hypothetical protein